MAMTVLSRRVMELIHTCYRIGEIDRSVAFYEALGFEERRRMPIREEAINVFMGLPGDGDRLELTYNHGVDSYELGTGYNHIALTVDDIAATLERLARAGHRAREAAVPGARGRVADRVRPRSGRLPDRADREARVAHVRVSTRGDRLRVELVPAGRLHLHRHVVEAHGRDPRGRARRRGPGRAPASCSRSRWSARWRRSSSTRTSARRPGSTRSAPVATSAIRDAANQAEFLKAGAQALRAGGRGARRARRRPATATSPRSTRRRSRTASCSTSAAARCSSRASRTARRSTRARGRWAPCA